MNNIWVYDICKSLDSVFYAFHSIPAFWDLELCIIYFKPIKTNGSHWPAIGDQSGFSLHPKSTPSQMYLTTHLSGMIYHKRTEHFEEKPFGCEECGAKFGANSSLKNHMRLHTGEKPYHCKHCDMSFSVAAALAYHTKKKHSEGTTCSPADVSSGNDPVFLTSY